MHIFLYTDGGARGNPGPAAIGIVLKNKDGKKIKELGLFIGNATNNDAEYQALIRGLNECILLKAARVSSILDSELVVNQLCGVYKVKNKRMKNYWNKVKELEKSFSEVTYKHVTRDQNSNADELVNKVLDLSQNA